MDSQVDASLQNHNLRTDLRWVAKRIRKSAGNFTHIQLTCDRLCVDLRWAAKR